MLRINDPGWLRRRVDDLIPDHTHLMHMYVIRLPEMEQVWHLHPDQIEAGVFAQDLPHMPAGRYQLFGDIVHQPASRKRWPRKWICRKSPASRSPATTPRARARRSRKPTANGPSRRSQAGPA